MKRRTPYALALIASLTLLGGCQSSSDSGPKPYANAKTISDPSQLSDAEKLAVAMIKTDKQPDIPAEQQSRARALQTQNCSNGGTMEYEIPSMEEMQNPDFVYNPSETVMSFHDCVEGGESINGKVKVTLAQNGDTPESITFLEDFSTLSDTERITIKKGSSFAMRTLQNGWDELIINADMTYNGIRHVGQDLIYRGRQLPNGTLEEYPVSGYEQIGDSALFEVDPTYDAGQTPFVTDAHDDTISGTARYLDDKKHAVEISVPAKNIVGVKVDQNGDGTFSEDETSYIALP